MSAGRMLYWLFCFKRPQVTELSYIPVLVKDEPVLFVAWQVKNAWSVQFKPVGRRFYKAEHAVMMNVPNHLQAVTVKAANCWRRTIIHLPLQTVQLSEAATAALIHDFRPLNKTAVHTPLVSHVKNQHVIQSFAVQQHNCTIQKIDQFKIAIQPFTINLQPFNYQ